MKILINLTMIFVEFIKDALSDGVELCEVSNSYFEVFC